MRFREGGARANAVGESSAKLLEVGHNVQVTNYLTRPVNNKYIQVYIYMHNCTCVTNRCW